MKIYRFRMRPWKRDSGARWLLEGAGRPHSCGFGMMVSQRMIEKSDRSFTRSRTVAIEYFGAVNNLSLPTYALGNDDSIKLDRDFVLVWKFRFSFGTSGGWSV